MWYYFFGPQNCLHALLQWIGKTLVYIHTCRVCLTSNSHHTSRLQCLVLLSQGFTDTSNSRCRIVDENIWNLEKLSHHLESIQIHSLFPTITSVNYFPEKNFWSFHECEVKSIGVVPLLTHVSQQLFETQLAIECSCWFVVSIDLEKYLIIPPGSVRWCAQSKRD